MREFLEKQEMRLFWAGSIAFVLLLTGAIFLENFYLMVLPVVLLVVYVAIFHIDKLFLLAVFCTPLSINIEEFGVQGVGLYLPTEPILFGILLLFIIRNFYRSEVDLRFMKHPVTVAIMINLAWMFLTCITSEFPMVSFKYYLARLWFIVPAYFLAVMVFKKPEQIKRMLWLYLIPLCLVAIYTLARHASFGFGEEEGHWVMSPFFKDHTSYGAILALLFPVAVGFLLWKEYSITLKIILFFMVTLLAVALFYSYTRAAWISLVGALGVYAAMRFRIKFSYIAAVVVFVGGMVALNWEQIQLNLEQNKAEHATEDIAERLESVSNISSDASNLERLNLWASAVEMFESRPVMGWGPGTFQFAYGQFQHYQDLTIISEKSGRDVNAHSEYLGPLAESGVIGMLSTILIVVMVVYTGITLYFKLPPGELRMITLVVLLGLITYFAHGVLNNYMDTDKASIPVWSMSAIIVAIDLYHRKGALKASENN